MEELNPKSKGLQVRLGKLRLLHVKTVIKAAFFAGLALSVLGLSFLWEESVKDYNLYVTSELEIDGSMMRVPGNGSFVSESDQVSEVLELSDVDGAYVFEMKDGRVWGNFGNSFSRVNIAVGDKIVVIPSLSQFDITFEEGTLVLRSYLGDTYVGFLNEGIGADNYMDEYSPSFGNVLMVPAGTQVKIPLSRVDERVYKLLYFKLVKEFRYSFIPDSYAAEDAFVKANLLDGFKFTEALKENRRVQFRKDNPMGISSALSDFLHESLIVFDSKEEAYYVEKLNRFLFDAVLSESSSKREDSLEDFSKIVSALPSKVLDSDSYNSFLTKWLSDLAVFGGLDSEYDALDVLIEKSQRIFDESYLLKVRLSRFNDAVYHDEGIEEAYSATYKGSERLFEKFEDQSAYKKFLTFQNQLLDNYLLRFPELYKAKYFEMKAEVESEFYELYYGGQLKEEMKQSFVRRKIDFLKRLQTYFFDEKIDLKDAKEVVSVLVTGVNDYMPAKTSDNAVLELFNKELSDIGNFWGYINDLEYSKSSLYGETHNERYEVYLEEKDQVMSILDVQRDVLGGEAAPRKTVAQITAEIRADLDGVGASSIKVGKIDAAQQRYVNISAIVGGHVFNGEYDRDFGTVSDLYAYGSLISSTGIKLADLESFITSSLTEVADEAGVSISDSYDESTQETNAQKIAKTMIAKKLVKMSYDVAISDVEIVDAVEALYRLNDIVVKGEGGSEFVITFDYLANTERVRNLYIMVDDESHRVSGEFPLDALYDVVLTEEF